MDRAVASVRPRVKGKGGGRCSGWGSSQGVNHVNEGRESWAGAVQLMERNARGFDVMGVCAEWRGI